MRRFFSLILFLSILLSVLCQAQNVDDSFADKLVAAAMERTTHQVTYDGSYQQLDYPGGDVPDNIGVCTDVIIRAYRKTGIDLQQLVHEDIIENFPVYPQIWGLNGADANIDHRRVPNLQTFLKRQGAQVAEMDNATDFLRGDLVTWMLPGNLPHIGIVVDGLSFDGKRPLVVHNVGSGPKVEDFLFKCLITGHYRYSGLGGGGPAVVIPESSRSRECTARVAPLLAAELQLTEQHLGSPIFIRIFKESKELEVWVGGDIGFKLFRTYRICAASGNLGPKLQQGDSQAPEGFYFVKPTSLNPFSSYHLSFNLGYPNTYDRHHHRTGSALMVHGNCVSIGCYAMTDPVIEEIYTLADAMFRNGHKFFRVHVFPFRMTEQRMLQAADSHWFDFWSNLKTGYDHFEREMSPPNVEVSGGRYKFGPSP